MRGCDVARKSDLRGPHLQSWPCQSPPILGDDAISIAFTDRFDLPQHIGKGRLKQGRFMLGHRGSEIDDPPITIPPCQVDAIPEWTQDPRIGLAVRVRLAQPGTRQLSGDVEWTFLGCPHETDIRIFR